MWHIRELNIAAWERNVILDSFVNSTHSLQLENYPGNSPTSTPGSLTSNQGNRKGKSLCYLPSFFVALCGGMWGAPLRGRWWLLEEHSCFAAFLNGHLRWHRPAVQLLSRSFSHFKPVLGWLFAHLSGKAAPTSSLRFSGNTTITSLSTAGDAFATMEYDTLLLSVITGAAGGKHERK